MRDGKVELAPDWTGTRVPRQVTQAPHGSQQEREAGRGDQGSEYP
jgi:hypothetical protein